MGVYVYESHLGGYYTSKDYISIDDIYCEQCGDSDWYLGWYNTFREFLKSNANNISADVGWGGYLLESVIEDIGWAFDDKLTYEEAKEIVLVNRTLDEEDEQMIIYTCPKCGGDIYHTCICTLPPVDVWACLDCDWRYEEKDGIEYRPFEPVKAKLDEDWTMEDE